MITCDVNFSCSSGCLLSHCSRVWESKMYLWCHLPHPYCCGPMCLFSILGSRYLTKWNKTCVCVCVCVCVIYHKLHKCVNLVYSTFPGALGYPGCVGKCHFWNLFQTLEFRSPYVQVKSNPLTVQDSYSCSNLPCMLVPVSSISRKRSVCILSYCGCVYCANRSCRIIGGNFVMSAAWIWWKYTLNNSLNYPKIALLWIKGCITIHVRL